ncbi:MAG: hypothetical protein ACTSQE_12530 [Candidatus Heimdallarchaeaceae archaeon]
MDKLDVIVLAGRSQQDDPLLEYVNSKNGGVNYQSKALIEIAGKPLITYVCDALHNSPSIGDIYIAGLTQDDIKFDYEVKFLDLIKDLSTSDKIVYWIREILLKKEHVPNHALIISSDIPTITSNHVEWFIKEVIKITSDLHYGVVERQSMEAKFPNSNRTYAKLKDGDFCGIDIFAINPHTTLKYVDTFRELSKKRKSFLKQAFFVAPFKFLKVVLRRATLKELAEIGEKSLKMSVNVLVVPFPELAMDIDKPFQYEIVKEYMEGRREE